MRTISKRHGGALAHFHLATLPILLACLLTGCGGNSSKSVSTVAATTAIKRASAHASAKVFLGTDAVAFVAGKPVSRLSFDHWLSVENALGVSAGSIDKALGFLITRAWLEDEASARGVSVSQAQAKQRLADLDRQSFPKASALKAFLAKSHESEADLLGRVRIELLQSGIEAQVAVLAAARSEAAYWRAFSRASSDVGSTARRASVRM